MKLYKEVEVPFHAFLNLVLSAAECLFSTPSFFFTYAERAPLPNVNCTGGWVGSRGNLDGVEKRRICCPDSLVMQPNCCAD
jgi:hypothetical protein